MEFSGFLNLTLTPKTMEKQIFESGLMLRAYDEFQKEKLVPKVE